MLINIFKQLDRLWVLLKQGKSIKDSVALGVVGGFLGTVVMSLSNFIIYRAGKSEILYGHIAASIFMKPSKTKLRKNFILGEIFHLANGSSIGLIMVLIFKKFGTNIALLKGSMLGMITWEGLYTVGQKIGIYSAQPHLAKTGYSQIWNNLLYSAVTAYSIKWLAHPSVFSSGKQNEKQPEKTNSTKNKFSEEHIILPIGYQRSQNEDVIN